MTKDTTKLRAAAVDWLIVEKDYRAGIKTLRTIARDHGVTHPAITKHAKRHGWSRDLSADAHDRVEDRSVLVAAPNDELNRDGFVYALSIDTGVERLYKVGLSVSPAIRAAGHQTSLPFDVRICIAYYVPNMRREERVLHSMFGDKCVRGEWFRLEDDDLNAMAMRARLA